MSKIIGLQASNVKRLRAVEIRPDPDGSMVLVGGRNAQGKSSVLDSIWMALGGRRAQPARPVRDGAEHASIRLALDNGLVVERTIEPDGKTVLRVSDGTATLRAPQGILDALVRDLSFDPLRFSEMAEKEQAELLRRLVGLDFSKLDRSRAEYYDERRLLGREVSQLEGELAGLPHHADAPPAAVSAAELAQALEDARAQAARTAAQRDAAHHKAERARELRAAAEAARRAAVQHDAEAEHLELESEADAYDVQQALETAPDLEAMRARLDQVEADNAKVRDNERRAAVAERLEKRRLAVEGLTASLAEIDEEKRAAIERAEFPLEGLGFAEEGVTLGGIPFAQASAAERLRASVAIGLALHPDLRVLLVRDGALLDDDSLKLVAEMAAAHEAQVWVERVGDGDPGAIIIEDGAVRADEVAT